MENKTMLTLEIVKKTNDADKAHAEAARDLWNTRENLNSSNLSEIEKELILLMKRKTLSAATKARSKAHAEYDRAKVQGLSPELQTIMGDSTNISANSKQM